MIFNEISTTLSADRVLVYPIYSSLSKHSAQTELSCLFISDGEIDCCINYKNLDVEPFGGELDLSRFKKVFVVDLKSFLYHYKTDNLYDLQAYLFHLGLEYSVDELPIHNVFRRRGIPKVGDLIPILKHYEFFGDNSTQWSWYNVPQDVRLKFWPEKPRLPNMGLDPNAPKTKFTKIDSHKGIPYATGEIYYCNWPQIVSRPGNKKMFLETTWAHPFEQTWMSHMYQQTVAGKLKPGLLLMTPTEHNRFDHYDRKLRKES